MHIKSMGGVKNHIETIQPVTPASVHAVPEFVDYKGARALFGFSRASLYRLAGDKKIKSVSVRNRGSLRGKRLFDCDSIRRFIASEMEGAN